MLLVLLVHQMTSLIVLVFLSHFDGANNGVNNAFDDGSASNHTITANGNVTQGSFNPYGTNWAVDFSKDANPRLSCGSSSDFTFGTGDFTIEFFVFFYSLTSYQTPMSAGYNDSGGMAIQTGNANGKFTFYSGGSAKVAETTSDAEANKWYHIAFFTTKWHSACVPKWRSNWDSF